MNFARAVRMLVVALVLLLAPGSVRGDAPPVHLGSPRDIVDAQGVVLVAPPLPPGTISVRRGPLSISYPPALESDLRGVLSHAQEDAEAVAHRLGMWDLPRMEVRLVADPDAMRRLAPADAPPPPYAVGVAYPPLGLALVSSSAPSTWNHADVRRVLRHEMAHLLLDAATRHATVPRWFSEGFAIDASGEHDFERFKALAVASFTGGVVPLRRLDGSFSSGADEVNVAYAESADFVAYLLRTGGPSRFAILLTHLSEGMSFDAAVRQTYASSLAQIESDWRHDVEVRFLTAPLWAGTGFLWFVGTALLVLAFVRGRSRSRATLARWDREERAAAAPTLNVTVVTPGMRAPLAADDVATENPASSSESDRASTKSPEVPAIVLDGERYTLH